MFGGWKDFSLRGVVQRLAGGSDAAPAPTNASARHRLRNIPAAKGSRLSTAAPPVAASNALHVRKAAPTSLSLPAPPPRPPPKPKLKTLEQNDTTIKELLADEKSLRESVDRFTIWLQVGKLIGDRGDDAYFWSIEHSSAFTKRVEHEQATAGAHTPRYASILRRVRQRVDELERVRAMPPPPPPLVPETVESADEAPVLVTAPSMSDAAVASVPDTATEEASVPETDVAMAPATCEASMPETDVVLFGKAEPAGELFGGVF